MLRPTTELEKNIFTKQKQLGIKLRKMYWLFSRRSNLSIDNKVILYRAILKYMWAYGIQLWGGTSNSTVLHTNEVIQHNIPLEFVKKTIRCFRVKHSGRVLVHPNSSNRLNMRDVNKVRGLKRVLPSDLNTESR